MRRARGEPSTTTHHHDDHGGLGVDLRRTGAAMKRRDMLRLAAAGGAGALYMLGCGEVTGITDGVAGACARIPSETAGPFPGDGSNGPNVLNQTGVVRSDVRSSFAGLTGEAAGVPLTVRLRMVDAGNDCAPASGLAVYMWHCDRAGRYSLYNTGVTDQNYLRGVQESDAAGEMSFTTIFPGCYSGRWPHIHFEVFPSLAAAVDERNKIATSQLAFPEDACNEAYAAQGYEQSVRNLAGVSLAGDNVFRDGVAQQLAATTGDGSAGFVATLVVAV